MKFYFEGKFDKSPREEGKLARVSLFPDTNSRQCPELFVLVANEIETPVSGENYNLGLVGEKKTPMIFPSTNEDDRILVMGNIPQPGHRIDGYIDNEKNTATIIREHQGGGAWGCGSVFLAVIAPGERVVSNKLTVWENRDGLLHKTTFRSKAEYALEYGGGEIEFI